MPPRTVAPPGGVHGTDAALRSMAPPPRGGREPHDEAGVSFETRQPGSAYNVPPVSLHVTPSLPSLTLTQLALMRHYSDADVLLPLAVCPRPLACMHGALHGRWSTAWCTAIALHGAFTSCMRVQVRPCHSACDLFIATPSKRPKPRHKDKPSKQGLEAQCRPAPCQPNLPFPLPLPCSPFHPAACASLVHHARPPPP